MKIVERIPAHYEFREVADLLSFRQALNAGS